MYKVDQCSSNPAQNPNCTHRVSDLVLSCSKMNLLVEKGNYGGGGGRGRLQGREAEEAGQPVAVSACFLKRRLTLCLCLASFFEEDAFKG